MTAALAAALLLAGAPDLPRVAVLPSVVAGPHGEATSRAIFDAARRGFGDRLDATLPSYEEVVLAGATSLASEVKRCGSDDACLRRALREAGMQYGLQTIANFALDPPLVTLTLIRADDEMRQAEVAEVPADGAWAGALEAVARRLADAAGFEPAGRLMVTPPAEGGRVELVDAPRGRRVGPAAFVVPPGAAHARWVRSDGARAEGRAAVPAFATVTLPLVAPEAPTVAVAEPPAPAWWRSPWLWVGVGVVAAGATTAALAGAGAFDREPDPACLCITTPDVPCGGC